MGLSFAALIANQLSSFLVTTKNNFDQAVKEENYSNKTSLPLG